MKSALIATTCVVVLTGCLIPERFTAKVDVQPDRSYTFKYSGTAIHALAAMEKRRAGKLSEKDEAGLKAEADKMAKAPDVHYASYKGDGRFDLNFESKKRAGETMRMFDIFSVSTDKDGVMTIASSEIKEKGKKDLVELGIAIDGTLEVTLPRNAEVLSHNATSTPKFFGTFGSYAWKIGRVDQRPVMKIRFKQ